MHALFFKVKASYAATRLAHVCVLIIARLYSVPGHGIRDISISSNKSRIIYPGKIGGCCQATRTSDLT
jgi:hypothetical protein